MQNESRIKKSILNAKVNLIFYVLMLVVSFFSRKIFLDKLGADFVGLTGTLQNILGFLNLAELGVGSAVSYALYKPISQGNKEIINEIVSVFGYLYRNVGMFVLAAAVILSVFIPLIFQKTVFDLGIIYFAFFAFLTSSLISYFVNYRQILLTADQRNYVVSAYYQTGTILKSIVQICLAYYTANLYLWVLVELSYGIIYSFILNWKIRNVYPWLSANVAKGKDCRRLYPEILTKTKQVFVHKIKDFLLTQSDQILIFAFVSLKMVAFYGNYVLVIGRITQLFNTTLDGMGAGVGNLIAEGNKDKIFRVFWELVCVRYFTAGIVVFGVWQCIEPFISLWLGSEYLLDKTILVLLLVNTFIMLTRGAVDMFNTGYGNYGDVWAAWAEGLINLVVTVVTAHYIGLAGVLIGKIASMLPIIVIWKPLFLYRTSFKVPIWRYWKGVGMNFISFSLSFALASVASKYIPVNPYSGFLQWIIYSVEIALIFIFIYIVALLILTPGAKTMLARIKKRN